MVEKLIGEAFVNSVYLAEFVLFALLAVGVYKILFKLGHKKGENLVRGAVVLGLAVATSPLYTGESYGLLNDLEFIGIYSFITIGLMVLGHIINDFVTFHKVRNIEEIKNGNLSLAVVEFANIISTGLVIRAILDNYSTPDYRSVVMILFLSFLHVQFLLNLTILLYEKFYQLKKLDLRELIYHNNISAGINLSSVYVVTAFLVVSAFNPQNSLYETALLTMVYFVASLIVVVFFKEVVDLVIVRETTIRKIIENDNYFKSLFMEMCTISIVFIYHFLS